MIEPFQGNHPGAELVPLVAKLNEVIAVVNGMLEVTERLEACASSSAAVTGEDRGVFVNASTPTRHGEGSVLPTWDALLSDDPALHLVHADPIAWMEAHPCECNALCECEDS